MAPLDSWAKKNIVQVNVDSNIYLKAIEEAQKTIDFFIAFIQDDNPEGFLFFIKKRFHENEFVEHLWIKINSYQNGEFIGDIDNEPGNLTNISYNEKIVVKKEDVEDWIVAKQKVIVLGNFIANVIQP